MEIVFASPSDDPRAASPRYVTRFVRHNVSDSPLPVVMTVGAEVQLVAGSRDNVTGMTRLVVVDAEGIVAAEEVEVEMLHKASRTLLSSVRPTRVQNRPARHSLALPESQSHD